MLEELILFVMCFVLVLIIYEVVVVAKAKKNIDDGVTVKTKTKKTKKDEVHIESNIKYDEKKYPIEVKYLVAKYNLDMEKVNYKQLLQIVALVSSFDISIIVSAVMIFDNYMIQLLASIVIVLPIMLGSYHLVGMFYKKKGMIKDV